MKVLDIKNLYSAKVFDVELEGDEYLYDDIALITYADNGFKPQLRKIHDFMYGFRYELANTNEIHHFGGKVLKWQENGQRCATIKVYID